MKFQLNLSNKDDEDMVIFEEEGSNRRYPFYTNRSIRILISDESIRSDKNTALPNIETFIKFIRDAMTSAIGKMGNYLSQFDKTKYRTTRYMKLPENLHLAAKAAVEDLVDESSRISSIHIKGNAILKIEGESDDMDAISRRIIELKENNATSKQGSSFSPYSVGKATKKRIVPFHYKIETFR